jgi:ribosomal protein L9
MYNFSRTCNLRRLFCLLVVGKPVLIFLRPETEASGFLFALSVSPGCGRNYKLHLILDEKSSRAVPTERDVEEREKERKREREREREKERERERERERDASTLKTNRVAIHFLLSQQQSGIRNKN